VQAPVSGSPIRARVEGARSLTLAPADCQAARAHCAGVARTGRDRADALLRAVQPFHGPVRTSCIMERRLRALSSRVGAWREATCPKTTP
jgi:hypothetical protein